MNVSTAPTPGGDADSLTRTLRGHMPVLDALRGVAILLVLAHRFDVTLDPYTLPARIICSLMDAGWVGVQLFFVLSGFLITGVLLDTRESPSYYRAFFARRVLRIFPLYYLVLAVAFIVLPVASGHQLEGHQHQVWLWIYLSNWATPLGLGVAAFPHFWSLAVEEQFYLVWPFVVRLFALRRLPAVCVMLIFAAFVGRVVLRALGVAPDVPYQNTLCRVDALAMGAIAAWALRQPVLARGVVARQLALVVATTALFVAGGVLTHGYTRDGAATQTIGYTIVAWSALVALVLGVLMQARAGRPAALLAPAALRSVGKYSYAMYIFHVPIHHELGLPLLARFGQTKPTVVCTLVYCIAMSAVTYACAFVSYQLLEKRFLRLKRRFPAVRAA